MTPMSLFLNSALSRTVRLSPQELKSSLYLTQLSFAKISVSFSKSSSALYFFNVVFKYLLYINIIHYYILF
jgi:hypothetical protein